MDEWFSEEGATGELVLEQREGSWFVASSTGDSNIKCVIEDDELVDDDTGNQQIEATVTKFRRGMDGRDSYLFVTPVDSRTEKKQKEVSSVDNESSQGGSKTASTDTWDLKDFRGSGEYVAVEATIDAVFYIKKDTRGVPDMKGELTDGSVLNPVSFVVEEGVNHPYLEEGKGFLFKNVKDHLYKKENEIQVVINSNTDFTEM